MSRKIVVLAAFVASLSFCGTAMSEDKLRVMLKGHDPIAYFTDGKPVKGNQKISYDWDDGRYYFASSEHRTMFASNPDRYAPQFGGYCTGSMSRGETGNEANPEAWMIADGKLYVFGAPDDATAAAVKRDYKQLAERDPVLFAAKLGAADKFWQERK